MIFNNKFKMIIIPLFTVALSCSLNFKEVNANQADDIEITSKKLLGLPYVWGGTSPNSGFDCSGFIQYVFKKHGYSLPRTAAEQYKIGHFVEIQNLQKGDLVYFETYKKGASHVGIYLSNGNFINSNGSGLTITNLNNSYYAKRYLGAKRVLSESENSINYKKNSVSNQNLEETHYSELKSNIETTNKYVENKKISDYKVVNKKQHIFLYRPIDEDLDFNEQQITNININNNKTKEELNSIFDMKYLPDGKNSHSTEVKSLFKLSSLTRAELAVAIYYIELKSPFFQEKNHNIFDVNYTAKDINENYWAKEPIRWVINNELLKLDDELNFNPNSEVTEEAALKIMNRIQKKYVLDKNSKKIIEENINVNRKFAKEYFEQLVYNITIDISENLYNENFNVQSKNKQLIDGIKNEKLYPIIALTNNRMNELIINLK